MGKPTICIGENKAADQLRSNCEADQRLCFRYSDSTIPPLLKKVQVGKDQEKAHSAKDSHSKNPKWEKTKPTIRYLNHENIP